MWFDPAKLALFLPAAALLIVMPGQGVLYVVTHSLSAGPRAGMAAAGGVGAGNLGHTVATALGLSALLAGSPLAYAVVQYAGAAYLLWLAIGKLRQPPAELPAGWQAGAATQDGQATGADAASAPVAPAWPIFRQGAVVGLLNPKTALFFLSFLPQFADPARGPVALQLLVLGLIFVVGAVASDCVYALLAARARRFLVRHPRLWQREKYASALIFGSLALLAALGQRPS